MARGASGKRSTARVTAGRSHRGGASRRAAPYHHGDLRRALLEEALRTIQEQGVDALTLRSVAERLGVSRTALYRHFASKQALLAAVATEGFRTLRAELVGAWETGGRGQRGFEEMGLAYVQFAVRYPSHYRVMFGGFVSPAEMRGEQAGVGTDAFQVLVDSIVEQQRAGLVRPDDPRMLAVFIWSVVHGVAMLALDGMLKPPLDARMLMTYANERLRGGIAAIRTPVV